MRAGAATVIDIAAYLGVTPARVRQIIAEHHIAPTGQRWKAKLYDPREVFRHAGAHHRSNQRRQAAS
jgi:hypothetical protein